MFYLFILESIGTSELLLIGLVALIIFGPRKMPELARMLGKAMNEFRRTTDDFKETWQREVDFEKEESQTQPQLSALSTTENSIQRSENTINDEIVVPAIRPISQEDFQTKLPKKDIEIPQKVESTLTEKRDWL